MNKSSRFKGRWLIEIGVLILFGMLIYACQPAPSSPTAAPVVPATKPPATMPSATTPLPDQTAIKVAWEKGPHSVGWDVGKGPNTMCTRCHSPQNWQPASRPGRPPNCVTCKFPTDKEMRVAPSLEKGGMDFVSEKDWVGIPCGQCHEIDKNGIASAKLAWLTPITKVYEPLNTPNELCEKCHVNGTGNKGSGGNGANHAIVLGGSAHANFAGEWPQVKRPRYCTDCHDAHSGDTKKCVDCHTSTAAAHTKVSKMMDKVTCIGCHDASGATVGRAKKDSIFTTLATVTSMGGGPPTTSEITSHSITWKVSCNRCHFEKNTWGLSVLTATGTIPPSPTPAPTPKP